MIDWIPDQIVEMHRNGSDCLDSYIGKEIPIYPKSRKIGKEIPYKFSKSGIAKIGKEFPYIQKVEKLVRKPPINFQSEKIN